MTSRVRFPVRITSGDGSPDRPELGDADRVVGEDLEQERLEFLVRSVDLVDEQHRRHRVVVVDGIEERPAQEKLRPNTSCSVRTGLALADSRMWSSWRA